MRQLCTGILIAASLLASGCRAKHTAQNEDKVVTAYKLIDAQRTDEAIQLLEAEQTKVEPGSNDYYRLTVVLASAYAHKAGIKVQKFVKFLQVTKENKVNFEASKMTLDRRSGVPQSVAMDNFLSSIGTWFRNFSSMTATYTSIPTIKPEDEPYLDFSLRLLDSVPKDRISQGDAVYRAIIRTVYIKHYIATHLMQNATINVDVQSCQIDFDKITTTLARLGQLGIGVYEDLALAQPSKAEKFLRNRDQLANNVTDLTGVSTFASLFDEATMTVANHALVQMSLGSLLKCPVAPAVPSSSSSASAASSQASAAP